MVLMDLNLLRQIRDIDYDDKKLSTWKQTINLPWLQCNAYSQMVEVHLPEEWSFVSLKNGPNKMGDNP